MGTGISELSLNQAKNLSWRDTLYTLLIALYLSVPAINAIGVKIIPALSGLFMTSLYVSIGLAILVYSVLAFIARPKVDVRIFVFYCLIIFAYIFTYIGNARSDLHFNKFITLTVIAMLCPYVKRIKYRQFVIYLMVLPFFGIFFLNQVFSIKGVLNETITMGISYAFLPTVIASIVYLFFYFKDSNRKFISLVFIAINSVYLFKIFQFGSRGPVLCIVTCFAILICFKYKDNKINMVSRKIVILMILLILVIANFWTVLGWVNSLLLALGIKINAISKLYRLQSFTNDISNGRLLIWSTVWKEIWKSPIYGHGLSTTFYNLKFAYPHNFILQLLYDGGLLLFIPLIFFFISGFVNWFRNCSRDCFAFGIVLFSMSIPGAMFSGDLWENGRLWLALSFFIYCGIRGYLPELNDRFKSAVATVKKNRHKTDLDFFASDNDDN